MGSDCPSRRRFKEVETDPERGRKQHRFYFYDFDQSQQWIGRLTDGCLAVEEKKCHFDVLPQRHRHPDATFEPGKKDSA